MDQTTKGSFPSIEKTHFSKRSKELWGRSSLLVTLGTKETLEMDLSSHRGLAGEPGEELIYLGL